MQGSFVLVGTKESTAAPNEGTTAVPPGKTTNSMDKEKKGFRNSNNVSFI